MLSDRGPYSLTRRRCLCPALSPLLLALLSAVSAGAACGGGTGAGGMTATGAASVQPSAAGAVAASQTSQTGQPGQAGAAAAVSGAAGAAMSGVAGAAVSGAAGSASAAQPAAPRADPSGAVKVGMGPPTFTRVWEEVLMPKGCAGAYCHGSGQGGLKFMKKEDAYSALVGVMAAGPKCASSGKLRVKASDPDASLILDKMSHEMPSCGDPMPIGTKLEPNCVSMNTSVCNSMADLKLMRDWISAGALND